MPESWQVEGPIQNKNTVLPGKAGAAPRLKAWKNGIKKIRMAAFNAYPFEIRTGAAINRSVAIFYGFQIINGVPVS